MYNERIGTKYFRGMLRLAIFREAFFMYTVILNIYKKLGMKVCLVLYTKHNLYVS